MSRTTGKPLDATEGSRSIREEKDVRSVMDCISMEQNRQSRRKKLDSYMKY